MPYDITDALTDIQQLQIAHNNLVNLLKDKNILPDDEKEKEE